jgi:hypothetical protein
MDEDKLNERIEQVSVSANKKVQLNQYEPILEDVTITAEVRDGDDVDELLAALEDRAWEQVERGVMERYETHVRKDDE